MMTPTNTKWGSSVQRLALLGVLLTIGVANPLAGIAAEGQEKPKVAVKAVGTPLGATGGADGLQDVTFSPDGKEVLIGTGSIPFRGGGVAILESETGRFLRSQPGSFVGAVAFVPGGASFLTQIDGKEWIEWDTNTLKQKGPYPGGFWAFSADGKRYFTGSEVRDVATGKIITTLELEKNEDVWWRADRGAFSRDGTRILTVRAGHVHLLDAGTGKLLVRVVKHGGLQAAALDPFGRSILTVGGTEILLWEPFKGFPQGLALSHPGAIRKAAFSPDGHRILALADCPGDVRKRVPRLWHSGQWRLMATPLHELEFVNDFAFHPNGKYFVTCSKNPSIETEDQIRWWETSTGKPIGVPARRHGDTRVRRVLISPDGKWLVTASDSGVQLWKITTESGQ